MRPASKLVAFTVMALIAMAASAATATATGPVEVHDEEQNHCNPCEFEMVGESQFVSAGSGIPIVTCEEELTGEVYEDGTGHFVSLMNANHNGLQCNRTKCNGVGEPASETEWPIQIEESAPGEEEMQFHYCTDTSSNPNGAGFHCVIHADIVDLDIHDYEVSATNSPCAGGVILYNATWTIEDSPIEIEHLPPVDPIEVHDESGTHCNPCEIDFVGESQIVAPPLGLVSSCEDEITAEVFEDGSGHVTSLTSQNHGSSCITQNCNGTGEPAAESEWPLAIGEAGPSEEGVTLRFCLDNRSNPNGTGFHCDVSLDLVNLGGHQYELSMTNQPCDTLLVSSQWEMQGTPIEVEHPAA